jgi:uncharacterized protein
VHRSGIRGIDLPMTDAEKVEQALLRLPIFPLPGAVLLPHALVPLHVFEPRYRKMTRDCIESNGVLALAHLSPASLGLGEEPPRVETVLGVGLLSQVEALPDGRFNIALKGVLRAKIVEELPATEPYRLVRAIALPDEGTEGKRCQEAGEQLQRLLLALCSARPGPGAKAVAQLMAKAQGPGQLADLIGGALIDGAGARQRVLEATSVGERLERVGEAVAALLARVAPKAESKALLN